MHGEHDMSWLDYFRNKKPSKPQEPKQNPAPETKKPTKSPKDLATDRGEPWVAVLKLDIDPANPHQGAFELDWNEKFVANLLRAGYVGRTDADVVDQWFQNVCRHVVMETWEQDQAMRNSGIYVKSRDIGDGRSEVS
jgi:hypothetical protein